MYMYNYSPSKLRTDKDGDRVGRGQRSLGSFDNLPAVPERQPSSTLLDAHEYADTQRVFNLYDSIDNLDLNFDKDCESDGSQSTQITAQQKIKDVYQTKMEEIEHVVKSIALPRFKLPDRPVKLAENSDVFADIDRNNTQLLEIFLPKLNRGDVLCIDVVCIPSDMRPFNLLDVCEGSYNKPVDHEPLDVSMSPSSSSTFDDNSAGGIPKSRAHSPFVPVYFNGEYEFNLTSAHGISSGRYILSVRNTGVYTQSVRCKMKLRPYVQARAIEDKEVITVNDIPQEEYCYFRFVLKEKDRGNYVTIRVTPHKNAAGTVSDPDLYVSNKYAGLVAVDRDNYIWRSTNIGIDQVDIHPDDVNAQRSGIFIIGVLGYRDLNSFSLEVNVQKPVRFIDLKPDSINNLVVRTDRYTFYRVPIDVDAKGKLFISVCPVEQNEHEDWLKENVKRNHGDPSALTSIDQLGDTELENQYGRGVYTTDSFVSSGIFAQSDTDIFPTNKHDKSNALHCKTVEDTIKLQLHDSPMRGSLYVGGNLGVAPGKQCHPIDSQHMKILCDSLPESIAKKTGVYPIMHLSSTCNYPTAESYTWRASGIFGSAKAMIETDEWLHSPSKFCYISVIGLSLPCIEAPMKLSIPGKDNAMSPLKSNTDAAKFSSPILPAFGTVPFGSPDGRGERSQDSLSQIKTGSTETKSHLHNVDSLPEEPSGTKPYINCAISLSSILDSSNLSIGMQKNYKIYLSVFEDMDGSSISQKDRMQSGEVDNPNLTYGEIEFPSFVRLLEDIGARDGQMFVDLGSGIGKAVLAAALSGINFLRCIGIEALPGLCKASRSAIEKCKAMSRPTPSTIQQRRFSQYRTITSVANDVTLGPTRPDALPGSVGTLSSSSVPLPLMEIWEGDMISSADENNHSNLSTSNAWWKEADIVFVSSICFTGSLLQDILNLAKNLKRGSVFITLKLPEHYNAQFKLTKQQWVKMSWGRCLVYVLQRL